MSYRIDVIASLEDNYIYAIAQDKKCLLVDPGSYEAVADYLLNNAFEQIDVLLTHSHADHVNGLPQLCAQYPQLRIFATQGTLDELRFAPNLVPETAYKSLEADKGLKVQDLEFIVLDTPGHCKNHVTYILDNCMFVGDLLFAAGCGRVQPTGDLVDLYLSLDKLKSFVLGLPAEQAQQVVFFPGHEYTISNIQFCRALDDESLPAKLDVIEGLARSALESGAGYTPVNFMSELAYNPFLRAGSPQNFAMLRTFKDNFASLHNLATNYKNVVQDLTYLEQLEAQNTSKN